MPTVDEVMRLVRIWAREETQETYDAVESTISSLSVDAEQREEYIAELEQRHQVALAGWCQRAQPQVGYIYGYVRDKGNGLVTFYTVDEFDPKVHGSGWLPLYDMRAQPQAEPPMTFDNWHARKMQQQPCVDVGMGTVDIMQDATNHVGLTRLGDEG